MKIKNVGASSLSFIYKGQRYQLAPNASQSFEDKEAKDLALGLSEYANIEFQFEDNDVVDTMVEDYLNENPSAIESVVEDYLNENPPGVPDASVVPFTPAVAENWSNPDFVNLALDQAMYEAKVARNEVSTLEEDVVNPLGDRVDDLENAIAGKENTGVAAGLVSNYYNKEEVDSIESGLQEQIDGIPSSKEVIELTDIESAPEEGEIETIYVAKDDNKIYRYEEISEELTLPEAPVTPTLTPTVSITDADNLQTTIDNASNGDVIFLANGTYTLGANLNVNKQVAIVGESQVGVLIQDSRGNSQSFVSVSSDNVTLKDLTIRHVTTESGIGTAIIASGAGFPQVRLNNFRMYNVKSQYSKGGLAVRSDNFVIQGCTFEVVAGSSTRRGILHYGNGGDSFIKNNLFINATTGALRAITPTSTTGTNPSDNQSGSLTIEGSTFSGNLSQFVNMDNHQGVAGDFELIVKDNVTPETNAFVVSFGGAANFGDLFSKIVLIGNTLTNNHSSGLGKGAFAIDALNGLLNYRSSPLSIVSKDNVLGQLLFRAGYSEASGSTGSIAGYNNTQVNLPVVELSEGASEGQYIELSTSQDLSDIEQDIADLLNYKYAQTVYVSKDGLDTNSGGQHSPFLTLTAAMDSITDATPSKRYVVKVAAGSYTEASVALKANVFVVGETKESVRISGNVLMGSSFTAGASLDNRSGFSQVTLLNAADFNWNTVQSAAGKLYFNEVVFASTVNLYGYNNAIAQSQFNACIIFGNLTISGINVGVFSNNVCFSNINLNQHPNGGMATILSAVGGFCSGNITQTAAVNDFNRRCSSFLRNFTSENLIVNGPAAYADYTIDSGSKNGAQSQNGGILAPINAVISQRLAPNLTNTYNMGDWGKQWFWNFGYVHASTGTDLFLISYPESYAPDSAGRSIGIYTDGAGLQANVNGGDIVLETASTSGTGIRGKIQLNGREIDVTSKKITNLADGSDPSDAVTKSQLDSIVQFNKETKTVDAGMISNGYVDLAFEIKPKSLVMFVDRLGLHEGYDYSISTVGGVSRVTFLSTLLTPSETALEAGDILNFTYAK